MAKLIQNGDILSGTSNDAANIVYTKSDGTHQSVQTKLSSLEKIDGITSDVSSDSESIAASIKCVNEINNSLNSKLKIQNSTFNTDAYGAAWVGSQKSDGSFPIFAWAGGDQWLECTILGQVSNNVMQYAVRVRNHDGTPYANKTGVTVGVVWANPTR